MSRQAVPDTRSVPLPRVATHASQSRISGILYGSMNRTTMCRRVYGTPTHRRVLIIKRSSKVHASGMNIQPNHHRTLTTCQRGHPLDTFVRFKMHADSLQVYMSSLRIYFHPTFYYPSPYPPCIPLNAQSTLPFASPPKTQPNPPKHTLHRVTYTHPPPPRVLLTPPSPADPLFPPRPPLPPPAPPPLSKSPPRFNPWRNPSPTPPHHQPNQPL